MSLCFIKNSVRNTALLKLKVSFMNIVISFALILASIFSNGNPELIINVTNIKATKGEIRVIIYNTSDNFLEEGADVKIYAKSVDEMLETIVIDDLPKGDYSIFLYHDENSDDECNLNFFGIPQEGYGFSNNFRPKLSAPDFDDCKFSLKERTVLDVELIQ